MTGANKVVIDEIKNAAKVTAGGVGVGSVSYFSALSLTDMQLIAGIFAGLMTGIYFMGVGFHTILKVKWDIEDRRVLVKKRAGKKTSGRKK